MKRRVFQSAMLTAFAAATLFSTAQNADSRTYGRSTMRPQTRPTTSSATLPRDQVSTGNREADVAWNEGSYARALKLYQEILARQTLVAVDEQTTNEIEYRVAVSLGKTEQWDKAIATGEKLIAKKTQQTARTLYWLGRLYTVVPHQGYKVGGVIYRGEDYPEIKGAEKPQQIYVGSEDATKTLELFEAAKIQAQKDRYTMMISRFAKAPRFLSTAEENDLNFDLAAWLPTQQFDDFIKDLEAGKNASANVDLTKNYDTKWNLPTKVLYLYNEIKELDAGQTAQSPLSIFAKGLFVRAYIQRMEQWAPKYDEAKKTTIKRPYPFEKLDAIQIWETLLKEFPKSSIADKTLITIAQTYQGRNDLVKARATYNRVLDLFPKSKWASDARANIQQIEKRELSIYSPVATRPGVAATFNLNTRNIKNVRFAAYKIKLENFLTRPNKLSDGSIGFTEFVKNYGSVSLAIKSSGAPVAEWNIVAKDLADYKAVSETVTSPLKNLGAYLVVAQSDKIRAAQIVVISDLMLLKKTDRDSSFVYAADAQSGAPVVGANVVIKETYWQNGANQSNWTKGQSDAQGFYDKKLVRGKDVYSSQVAAFAWLGDRYALTGQSYNSFYAYNDNRDELKIYSYTDRPVYRPAQKVYFRQILTNRVLDAGKNPETVGDQQPAKNIAVKVTVSNPKGEVIYDKTLTTSEFGTINGDFDLPTETPLGEYTINAGLVKSTIYNIAASGGNRFRVEEYKRPEFAVTVDAPDLAVRVGETVAAKINAKYYFGSPVPNATVKYTVRRSTWWANYRFPTPYDWLWSYWGEGDYNTGRRNIGGDQSGTIVKEGTVKTDASGNAEVSFTATDSRDKANTNDPWYRYQNPLYTIEASVTDASRRTIDGQGEVRLARQQYFAFLNLKGGFYQQGDRVPVELRIQDANDKPQAANGKIVVYKQLPGDKEDRVLETPISVDKSGAAFWNWNSDQSGQFRIAYEAIDAWGNKIETSTVVWIAGKDLNTTQFRLQGVTIVLDKRSYEEGETLRALLVADQPDTTVLFTQEAGGDILKRQLVRIEGKSKVIEIPIEHKHVPNFALAAALVKNFEVYQAQEEVFVPPVQQLINVSVKGDKTEYKPGETGTFTVSATDWKGRPARAEVSLAMIDASLFYIQKSYAPDVRTFYYGQRRANSVNLDSSRSGQVQTQNEDDNSYGKYEQHGWELPDGLGQLNLDPAGWGYYGYYAYGGARRRGAMSMNGANEFGQGMLYDSAAAPMAVGGMIPVPSGSTTSQAGTSTTVKFVTPAEAAMYKSAARLDQSSTGLAPAQTRNNFAETAFWSPAVITENGSAQVKVTFPDSLTQWHATARGLTQATQVGSGESDVETKKNLLVRLQSPRFFTERDQVVLSANVHNYLKADKQVKVSLDLGGDKLYLDIQGKSGAPSIYTGPVDYYPSDKTITIKAGAEARVDWTVEVAKAGTAKVKMTAQSDEESDAVEMSFPVVVHGVQRFASQSGVLKDGTKQIVNIDIPKERRMGASTLNVQLNPSYAATMLDALPYLADYPYGCVEQTMSRFLPTVIAERTLKESGVNLQTLRARALSYKAESSTRSLGERVKNTGYTYPTGMPNSRDLGEMASKMWFTGRGNNPIYDKAETDKMTREGLQRLYAMQRSDGGWGWWPGSAQSDEYMTAYVVYGLATAKAAGVDVRDNVLNNGYKFLEEHIRTEENLHLLTYMAYALSQRGPYSDATMGIIGGRVYDQRERLTAYSKALLAMTLQNTGEPDKAQVLVRNLENTAKVDEANGTARYKTATDWWNWWNNDVETNAIVLRTFLKVEPTNRLVPMLAKWLTTNARGNHWRSTKETAEVVYTLADYVRVNKELDVDYTLKVNLNGKVARTYKVNSDNALFFDNRFIAGDLFLQDGNNVLTIEKQGRGTLYWSAASEYFSLEEPIAASGNEIAIKRRYFKLTRNEAVKAEQNDAPQNATGAAKMATSSTRIGIFPPSPVPDQTPREPEFTRTELKDGDGLKSGDLVEVELTLTSKNDYSYLVFEDMKAAGFEPVDVRSGGSWGDGLSSNVELRDEKVAFFVDNLPQGTRVLRYQVRAEIPGRFHALPTNGYAMYAPEVRAISDEMRLNVAD